MERVCIFIDGSSFYFSLKRNNKITRVDYHQLSLALAGPDRSLVRTYYYNSTYDSSVSPDLFKNQQPFFDSLAKTPLVDVRLGRLIPLREGGFRDKGADVRMAADLVYYGARDFFDTAIVVSEDPDTIPAISNLKELGPHVEIGLFRDSQPRDLVSAADRVLYLDEVLSHYASKIFQQVSFV